MRKILLAAVFCLVFLGAAAASAWHFFLHRIALNEKAPGLIRINQPGEDFAFRSLDGAPVRLSSSRGKVVFLDLWGTWCIQCVAEMPTVQKLYDRYRNDPNVSFVVISRLDSPTTVRHYARLHRYDLPFYTMNDEDIPSSMRLGQFPATFLYARDGSLAAKHTGAADWSAPRVTSFIEALKQNLTHR
jgi:thiol-disulfide isomerase/thioredoxin